MLVGSRSDRHIERRSREHAYTVSGVSPNLVHSASLSCMSLLPLFSFFPSFFYFFIYFFLFSFFGFFSLFGIFLNGKLSDLLSFLFYYPS